MFESYKLNKYCKDICAFVYEVPKKNYNYSIQTYLVLKKDKNYKFIKYLEYKMDGSYRLEETIFELKNRGYKPLEQFLSEEQQKSNEKIKRLKKSKFSIIK